MNNYIFNHEGVLKHVEAELPTPPRFETYSNFNGNPCTVHSVCYCMNIQRAYESSLESIREKGVEIANPDETMKIALPNGDGKYNPNLFLSDFLYEIQCEVREQRQCMETRCEKDEWFDVSDGDSISTAGGRYEYRTVVYLSPKKETETLKKNCGYGRTTYCREEKECDCPLKIESNEKDKADREIIESVFGESNEKPVTREDGYYRVKQFQLEDWVIALWEEDFWSFIGVESGCRDKDLFKIDENRIEIPHSVF